MITIDKNSSKPYYEQLMLSSKEAILQGILQPGDKIPSVREMAKQQLMNPNTVSKAYKVLEAEQVLITIKGKGTFVKDFAKLPRDELRIAQLKDQMNDLVIEATHLKVTEQELITWIEQTQAALGGPEHESHETFQND